MQRPLTHEEQNQQFHMPLDAAADLARTAKRERMMAPIMTGCSSLLGFAICYGILYLMEKPQESQPKEQETRFPDAASEIQYLEQRARALK